MPTGAGRRAEAAGDLRDGRVRRAYRKRLDARGRVRRPLDLGGFGRPGIASGRNDVVDDRHLRDRRYRHHTTAIANALALGGRPIGRVVAMRCVPAARHLVAGVNPVGSLCPGVILPAGVTIDGRSRCGPRHWGHKARMRKRRLLPGEDEPHAEQCREQAMSWTIAHQKKLIPGGRSVRRAAAAGYCLGAFANHVIPHGLRGSAEHAVED